jgi:hypothetical protein
MAQSLPDVNDPKFSDYFIDKSINNVKGLSIQDRFVDIVSDPSNLLIPRVMNAGKVENNIITLHNGIKVYNNCYYSEFSNILKINGGCHEPSEERMFIEVLKRIPEGGTMIELGSYWAFYTIWFNKMIKNAKNYCVEPDLVCLKTGMQNCILNNVIADFTHAFVGKGHLNIATFAKSKGIDYIDILHSDIQGYEMEMLDDIGELLDECKIRYLFVSTHSDKLHYDAIDFLKAHNYRIIASADCDTETFCYDGIIVACHSSNMDIPWVSLGNRKHTKLRIL